MAFPNWICLFNCSISSQFHHSIINVEDKLILVIFDKFDVSIMNFPVMISIQSEEIIGG